MIAWTYGKEPSASTKLVEEIFNKYEKLMFFTARKYTTNISDQEDIVQTALERLVKKFTNFDTSKRCISPGYIVYTVRSVSIDFLREQGRESKHYDFVSMADKQIEELAKTDGTLDDWLLSQEHAERLNALWPQVPGDDRILLEGKYIFGLADEELAAILKCKPNSIRMKLTRARRRAIRILSEREG